MRVSRVTLDATFEKVSISARVRYWSRYQTRPITAAVAPPTQPNWSERNATDRSVDALRDDPTSILHLYRRLLAARKASPALHRGTQEPFELPEGVLGWRRFDEESGDERIVLVNFTADAVHLSEGVPTGTVELSSLGTGEGEPLGHELRPNEAVVVRP